MAQIDGSVGKNKYIFYAIVTETVPSDAVATNSTQVNVKVYIQNHGVRTSTGYWTYNLDVNGENVIHNTNQTLKTNDVATQGGTKLLMEKNVTVPHNSDGTKTVNISAYISKSSYGQYDPGYCSLNGNVPLYTIPRASEPSCSNVTLGNAVTINTNRKSDAFTHTIKVYMGNTLIETFTSIDASKSWTPSIVSYAPYITSGTTGTAIIYCETYNGSTKIGDTKSCSVILTVPSSVKPSASISISEGDPTMRSKNWNLYVKNKSKLNVVVTGNKAYNSNIKSYSSKVEGTTYTSSSYTSNVLKNSGSSSVTATVTDNRGSTSATVTSSYSVVDYFSPTIEIANVVRCLSNGTESDEGTYLKCAFKAKISSVSNKNSATFKIGYKLKTASNYTYTTVSPTNYEVNKTGTNCLIIGGGNISNASSYDIIFVAQDAFETITTNSEVGTGKDIINFNRSGKAIAFGKISEAGDNEELIELGWNTKYKGLPLLEYEVIDEW